jgi:hypothetical protein
VTAPVTDEKPLKAFNYCVSFIDLLGQRSALRGQQTLPHAISDEAQAQFDIVLRDSVLAIARLQSATEQY